MSLKTALHNCHKIMLWDETLVDQALYKSCVINSIKFKPNKSRFFKCVKQHSRLYAFSINTQQTRLGWFQPHDWKRHQINWITTNRIKNSLSIWTHLVVISLTVRSKDSHTDGLHTLPRWSASLHRLVSCTWWLLNSACSSCTDHKPRDCITYSILPNCKPSSHRSGENLDIARHQAKRIKIRLTNALSLSHRIVWFRDMDINAD